MLNQKVCKNCINSHDEYNLWDDQGEYIRVHLWDILKIVECPQNCNNTPFSKVLEEPQEDCYYKEKHGIENAKLNLNKTKNKKYRNRFK